MSMLKTQLMPHQREGVTRMFGRDYFALLMEQGTGKTLTFLAHLLREYNDNRITSALIIAPNSVQINWTEEEIPKHVNESFPIRTAYYISTPNAKERRRLDDLFERGDGEFRVLSMNFESLITDKGLAFATKFLNSFIRPAIVIDESHRIKNLRSKVTKRILSLVKYTAQRYIGTGTAILNSPIDAFAQFQFLSPGLLGTESMTVFKSRYCELLPEGHGLLRHIQARTGGRFVPQVVAKDKQGNPQYKNLDELARLIEQYSFRVTKAQCLSLPEKVYSRVLFRLNEKQRKVYDDVKKNLRYEMEENLHSFSPMVAAIKLQQITSNYITINDIQTSISEENTRLNALLEIVEDTEGSIIIWARFTREILEIAKALEERGEKVGVVRGAIKPIDRKNIVSEFESFKSRILVAQPKTGGTGLTIIAASTVIYYSQDYAYGSRSQSEDRTHRIGQDKTVTYIDLVALDTVDEKISRALDLKGDVSRVILGDLGRE